MVSSALHQHNRNTLLLKQLLLSLVFIALLLITPSTYAVDTAPTAPVRIPNQYPLAVSQLTVQTESPYLVTTPGMLHFRSTAMLSNTFNDDKRFTVDTESRSFEQTLSLGVAKNLELSISLSVFSRGSGFLDSTMDQWHQAFSLPRGGRDKFPDNDYSVFGTNSSGSDFTVERASFGMGDPRIRLKSVLWQEETASIGSAFSIQPPTGAERFSHGGTDLMLELFGAKQYGSTALFLGTGFAYSDTSAFQSAELRQYRPAGFFAITQALSDCIAVGSSYIISAHPNAPVEKVRNSEHYWDFFIVFADSQFGTVEIALRENPVSGNTTTDATFFISYATPLASLW